MAEKATFEENLPSSSDTDGMIQDQEAILAIFGHEMHSVLRIEDDN